MTNGRFIIEQINNPTFDADGVTLPVVFTNGKQLQLSIPFAEFPNFLGYFLKLTEFLNKAGYVEADEIWVGPLSINGIGFGQGDTAADTHMAVDLSGVRLVFQIDSNQLLSLSHDIVRTAHLLSADHKNSQ